LTAETVRVI